MAHIQKYKEEMKAIDHQRACLQQMLKLVQTEINKHQIEEMHFKSMTNNGKFEEADVCEDIPPKKSLDEQIREMDDISTINQKSLELTVKKPKNACEEEEEEEDISTINQKSLDELIREMDDISTINQKSLELTVKKLKNVCEEEEEEEEEGDD